MKNFNIYHSMLYLKKLVPILIISLLLSSCSSSRKLTSQLNTTLEEFPAFKTGFAGIMVYDPTSKKVIFEHNSEKYFTPASNTKLFTFYAGLKILGDSAPGLEYVVRNDSLIFRGTGDPSFLYDKFENTLVLDFLKERDEKLFYAPPGFKEEHFGPGWSWDDYNYYYSVERSAMPIYGNYAAITFSPEAEVPSVKPEFFSRFLRKDSLASGNYSRVMRDRNYNNFTYHHQTGGEKRSREVPFIHTPQLLAQLLTDTLQKPVKVMDPKTADFRNSRVLYSLSLIHI